MWREGQTLPLVVRDDDSAVLEVLVSQRDAAVAEATRLRNQSHQLLLQGDPSYREHVPALTTEQGIAALETYQAPEASVLAQTRAAMIRMLGQRLRLAVAQAEDLKTQIEARSRAGFSPLIQLLIIAHKSAGGRAAARKEGGQGIGHTRRRSRMQPAIEEADWAITEFGGAAHRCRRRVMIRRS